MRLNYVTRVAQKEILSTWRDRRAIISNLLIPLLILPLVMLGLPLIIGGLFQREQSTITELAVSGLEFMPEALQEAIEKENLQLVSVADPLSALQAGAFDLGLIVPAEFKDALANNDTPELELLLKPGSLKSSFNASKLERAVAVFKDALIAERLQGLGLSTGLLSPFEVTQVNASSPAERSSGQLSWLIPFLIAIWTLSGGQMAAIDATAGEKERGTLEALLVSPVRRSEVVLGKFLATLLFGLSAAIMAIIGYVLASSSVRYVANTNLGADAAVITELLGNAMSVGAGAIVLLVMSALLLAGLMAALLISITMFARSFKEAQSYVAPLSMIMILPAVGLQFADLLSLGWLFYTVPILNALLIMDDIVKGSMTLTNLLVCWGCLLGWIIVLLVFAQRSFSREDVIFRS